ncbi:MAG: class I SAM-dependent methyltransferase [Rhodocyclaceae bacterium]
MMATDAEGSRNWFERGGQDYARYRPHYPPALAAFLATIAADLRLAVDVGCGTGQLTRLLADHFDAVVGLDPSADQIANATPHARVRYEQAPAEHLPLRDASATLVTAAQAAHWFDLPAFHREVRRIGAPACVLALISYGIPELDADLDARFKRFYHHEIGPYWPPERQLVDSGYATMAFPFAEIPAPAIRIELDWDLPAFLGYLSTWSAVHRAREAGRADLLHDFAEALARQWGDAAHRRTVAWPVNMRVGRL